MEPLPVIEKCQHGKVENHPFCISREIVLTSMAENKHFSFLNMVSKATCAVAL
jgi:hypothetical protein